MATPSLRALRYFLAAFDRRSISEAAKAQNVAASAVSTAIDQVEDAFGATLLQRFPAKGLSPTPAGIAIGRRVRGFLEEYDLLVAEGREIGGGLSGRLAVGYYAPVAPAFLPGLARALCAENPDVELSLVECDNEAAQDGLAAGRFDVILFVAESLRPGLRYASLLEAHPYLLTPADHPLAERREAGLEEIAAETLVLLDVPVAGAYYRDIIASAGHAPKVVATATSTEMVRSLVAEGLGCAILNMRPRIGATYSGGAVACVPISPKPRPLTLSIAAPEGRPRRLASAFIEACRAYFAAQGGVEEIVVSRRRAASS